MPHADACAWLITNHAPKEISSGYHRITGDLIAVDKGLEKLHVLGLTPLLIIGDFDSIDPDILKLYPDIPRISFETAKNETDTELALNWCIKQGYSRVVICNDMQGRFDHSAAIIQNLIDLHQKAIDCRIDSGQQTIFFLGQETLIPGKKGDLLSLISYSQEARFAASENLQYPLAGLVIHQHQSRGISNVFSSSEAHISLQSGLVLAIHTHS